jgi:tetratricopeptide (TPR) repeat protein
VELDGGRHAEARQAARDVERREFLESRGIRVLRFWDNEVLQNLEGVLMTIPEAIVDPSPRPSPEGRGRGCRLDSPAVISKAERRLAVLLLAACLVPFANGLGSDFAYDDKAIVRDNVRIASPSTLGQIFETSYFGGPRGAGTAYRPVLLLSFAVQRWIHGARSEPFHAVNLLFHGAATFWLWRLLLRLRLPEAGAFVAALLFALHPLHVEAVTSLVGRGETMAALLVLAYLSVAIRLSEPARRRTLLLLSAWMLLLLALLTKESAAAAPALAFLALAWLAPGGAAERAKAVLGRGWPLLAGSAAVLVAVFVARSAVLGGFLKSARTGIFEVENPLARLPAIDRAENACLLLLRYVGRFFLPLRLSADESAWSIRPAPAASLAAVGATILVALAVTAALRRPRLPASLGLLFFFAALLPASNLLFPTGTIFAERLTYLPSAGLCVIAGVALAGGAPTAATLTRARKAAIGGVVLLLGVRTAARTTVWASDVSLFENSVHVAPGSSKNHYNLGTARGAFARWTEAEAAYAAAVRIYPGYWDALAGIGKSQAELGRLAEARASYERSLAAQPTYENGFFGLGQVLEQEGEDRRALEVYRRGFAKHARSLPLGLRVAALETHLGEPSAGGSWRRVLADHPGSLPGRVGYAVFLRERGEPDRARRELVRALALAPRYEPALAELAAADAAEGRPFGAALARERVFRSTRRSGDLVRLLETASRSPAYERRFGALRPRLESAAPWAFRYAEALGALTPLRPSGSGASAGGG